MPDLSRRKLLAGLPALAAVLSGPGRAAPAPDAPRSELVYEAVVDIGPMVTVGDSPLGVRRLVPITGGTFEGPGLRGTVLPGGADRQLVRKDGARQLDALYEMKTDDGVILTIHNKVLIDDPVGGRRYAFSTVEISAPEGKYGWLNRLVFVGTLQALMPARQAVSIRVYKIN
ncbi:hypothetical protein GCM10027321_45270 [Massilia terrae]|uniref:UPF0311 protein NX778_01775 n=1 Tax=Massilia terrae TaxID=1811224 RepID=A0ABT2CS42_9BURK|nr:DUF3237 domain-containing protein [Massilia terrae]MCS0656788.1 DUF3237 domain-containing protein [Massilia terrae]